MTSISLGESPEVIHLFESMEQNRLYVEKSQMEEIVAHMDELLTSIKQIEKELADMQALSGNMYTPIVDESRAAVSEAKSVVQRVKDTIRDTAGKAAMGWCPPSTPRTYPACWKRCRAYSTTRSCA